MSSKFIMEIECEMNATQQVDLLAKDVSTGHIQLREVINYLEGMQAGARNAAVNFKFGAVAASVAGTFTGAPSANETITLNGVVFTAKASGATGNQFNIGGTVTITATNLAAAVNASVTAGVKDVISASSLAGVVTFTSKQAGKVGNAIVVAEGLSNFTFAGSATAMSGGTQQDNLSILFGLAPSVAW